MAGCIGELAGLRHWSGRETSNIEMDSGNNFSGRPDHGLRRFGEAPSAP